MLVRKGKGRQLGKAIVVSEVGGFPELAAEGAASLVPPDDPDALAAALAALMVDRAARQRLADAARGAARRSYSWQEAAMRTLRVYDDVIGLRRRASGDPPQSRPR